MSSWTLSDLIDLNAGDAGRPLTWEVPAGLLLDRPRCRMIQLLVSRAAVDGAWEVLPATLASASSVPRCPGIYMFVWSPALSLMRSEPHQNEQLRFILYVGKAGGNDSASTLQTRFRSYTSYFGSNPELLWSTEPLRSRSSRMKCFLSLEPLEYWFLACDSASNIDEIEARLLSVLNPPINKKKEPILRARAPRKAF